MDIKTKCDIGDTIFFKQGEELIKAIISKIEIERTAKFVKVNVFTAKPGLVIGKGGNYGIF